MKQKNRGICDHRYEKCKQSQRSYEHIRGIEMADQKQSQDKKTYLEMINVGRRGGLFGEEKARFSNRSVQREARRGNKTVKGA